MNDFFFQIVLLLVGALLGGIAGMLKGASLRRFLWALAAILVVVSLVWVGYVFAARQRTEGGEIATAVCALDDAWSLYDDFTEADAFAENWRLEDEHALCTFEIRDDRLLFDCANESTTDDYQANLHPSRTPDSVAGVAATVRVEEAGGPLQLVTNWLDGTGQPRWAYHLESGVGVVQAIKYDLAAGGWDNPILLAEVSTEGRAPRVLQIERTEDALVFCVDGQQVAIDRAASVSSILGLNYWAFTFRVWQDGNNVVGQLDRIDVKVEGR
jgi:hypothetical protein